MQDDEESYLVRERRAKVERLREAGIEPYPWDFPGRVGIDKLLEVCKGLAPGASNPTQSFAVAGRLKAIRGDGRSAFLDLEDAFGSVQLYARVDELGAAPLRQWLADLDLGDLIGAVGTPLRTRRGEPSLLVRDLRLLAKALHPPPEKFHGLQDAEERIRRRYADLIASPETRRRFRTRSALVHETRVFLEREGFLEVQTPSLVPVASGAAAQPFVTRSNYLDSELQLRIALELPLKRLLVGGFEKVYEIGSCFRNEDLDSTHSPEFTMLEIYWAYADYHDMRRLTEALFARLAEQVAELLPDSPEAREAAGRFRPPLPTLDFVDELEHRSGIEGLLAKSREQLRDLARKAGASVPDDSTSGKFLDKLFAHYVEPTIDRPTFVLDFPEATTPLAKRHRTRPGRVERFELYAKGFELANAYTELNDPDEQERRFREQLAARGEEGYAYDPDFVEALRYGMPPATGIGMCVERIVMALTGIPSIKDVILFPQARPKA